MTCRTSTYQHQIIKGTPTNLPLGHGTYPSSSSDLRKLHVIAFGKPSTHQYKHPLFMFKQLLVSTQPGDNIRFGLIVTKTISAHVITNTRNTKNTITTMVRTSQFPISAHNCRFLHGCRRSKTHRRAAAPSSQCGWIV